MLMCLSELAPESSTAMAYFPFVLAPYNLVSKSEEKKSNIFVTGSLCPRSSSGVVSVLDAKLSVCLNEKGF